MSITTLDIARLTAKTFSKAVCTENITSVFGSLAYTDSVQAPLLLSRQLQHLYTPMWKLMRATLSLRWW
ncbi:hypothetical protein DPMN_016036 [Dreissena polymorpha]|uniref:Uncharacterized protein n=1 Tax=Dreissena polymorpha TaxID=45954 RepID=A0A9D4NCP1_DREPO|nr:hypothetical protein DPMN_016036 [Dreissena polymorpha]